MNTNPTVTEFLNQLDHPLREEIELIRKLILGINAGFSENVKWNGPNFMYQGEDRITMRINPPGQLQLIFHRGAKVLEIPENKLIEDPQKLMTWKTNDRAVISFKNQAEIEANSLHLITLVKKWVKASSD